MNLFKTFAMTAFMAASLLAFSSANAQSNEDEEEDTTPCGFTGATGCTPIGGEICTGAGCYQMVCNAYGCDLVFTPASPIKDYPRER
jgi:hypothetical protein